MALSDVLKPKTKEELAVSIIDFYNKDKSENNEQWSVVHILKENNMGDDFINEVKKIISNNMKSTPEDVLLITSNSSIFKPFITYLEKDDNKIIKGKLFYDYKLYENSIVRVISDSKSEAFLISKKTFEELDK